MKWNHWVAIGFVILAALPPYTKPALVVDALILIGAALFWFND